VVRVVAGGGLPLAVAATPHNRVRVRVLMVRFITGEVIRVQGVADSAAGGNEAVGWTRGSFPAGSRAWGHATRRALG
jgi:hypothetical protein